MKVLTRVGYIILRNNGWAGLVDRISQVYNCVMQFEADVPVLGSASDIGLEFRDASFTTTESYINDTLEKREVSTSAKSRPMYTIAGTGVIFRSRQEAPLVNGIDFVVPGGSAVYPVSNPNYSPDQPQAALGVQEYVDSHQANAPVMVVTNTPEGILLSAAMLVTDENERQRLTQMADRISSRGADRAELKSVVDTLLAAIGVDDDGSIRQEVDYDGWALALAAYAGDTEAQSILDQRKAALLRLEREESAEHYGSSVNAESLPLNHLALIHSTSHEVVRDEHGNIVLQAAGSHREDHYPRASLHFTINSLVSNAHGAVSDYEWSPENTVIVGNLKSTIDANGKMPYRMTGVDTYMMLDPQERLIIPGAIVVVPVAEGELPEGLLISQDGDTIRYVEKASYRADELASIRESSIAYGAQDSILPRQLALRMAMSRVGVPIDLMDWPSVDGGTSMGSESLDRAIRRTAATYGIPSGLHFGQPEATTEQHGYLAALSALTTGEFGDPELRDLTSLGAAPLESCRFLMAGGFYPAAPLPEDTEPAVGIKRSRFR